MPYKLSLSKAYNQYGAYMGRPDSLPENRFEADPLLHLTRIRLSGDYDNGGAYWGGNSKSGSAYCAEGYTNEGEVNEEYVRLFVRAHNHNQAKQAVLATIPHARFYR